MAIGAGVPPNIGTQKHETKEKEEEKEEREAFSVDDDTDAANSRRRRGKQRADGCSSRSHATRHGGAEEKVHRRDQGAHEWGLFDELTPCVPAAVGGGGGRGGADDDVSMAEIETAPTSPARRETETFTTADRAETSSAEKVASRSASPTRTTAPIEHEASEMGAEGSVEARGSQVMSGNAGTGESSSPSQSQRDSDGSGRGCGSGVDGTTATDLRGLTKEQGGRELEGIVDGEPMFPHAGEGACDEGGAGRACSSESSVPETPSPKVSCEST